MYTGGTRWILMYKKNEGTIHNRGKFVAIDVSSGYPYPVDYPWEAKVFVDRDYAEEYARHFPHEFQLCFMRVEVEQI